MGNNISLTSHTPPPVKFQLLLSFSALCTSAGIHLVELISGINMIAVMVLTASTCTAYYCAEALWHLILVVHFNENVCVQPVQTTICTNTPYTVEHSYNKLLYNKFLDITKQ